jgi:hypothetical protein
MVYTRKEDAIVRNGRRRTVRECPHWALVVPRTYLYTGSPTADVQDVHIKDLAQLPIVHILFVASVPFPIRVETNDDAKWGPTRPSIGCCYSRRNKLVNRK